jgi:tetratricopeptide (TPR) repeat protein
MQLTRKFLACSLPLGFLALSLVAADITGVQSLPARAATIADSAATESPAQLRLAALDTLMKGDKHSALDLYEEAIRLATKQFGAESTFLGDLYYEAGKLYLDLDQFNQAENYLGQAIKINPKNASARLALAKLLDTEKKVQESIGQIREALVINPTSPVARERFIHTLSKYGRTASDIAIATQEAATLASMQRLAKESLQQQHSLDEKKIEQIKATRAKTMVVPSLPKNLAPIKEEGEGAPDTKGSAKLDTKNPKESVKETTTPPNKETSKEALKEENKPVTKPGSALSLFPLQNLSERKKHDALNHEIEERAKKRMAEEMKKAESGKAETAPKENKSDVVEKIKEQARQQEKTKSARKKQKNQAKEQPAQEKAAREKPTKEKAGAEKGEAAAQQAAPQQAAPQQQMMQPYAPVPVFQQPVYTAPAAKTGKHGFVPPPPPTMPMYPGMMPPVVPQMIPAQAAKPPAKPAAKPKVEKPKAPVKEEAAPVEDKPPPMTSGSQEDTSFLLDWSETKPKSKKKTK